MVTGLAGTIDARESVVRAAYPLFLRNGIRNTSIDQVREAARIGAEDFDRLFGSRDELAAAFLELREREWTVGIVETGARRRGSTPEAVLLAIFDVFDEWFQRDDYEACGFVKVLLEMGREHPLGRASIVHLSHLRTFVTTVAAEAGLREPETFASSWQVLMHGAIISAAEGDTSAARRAREMGTDLIARFRPSRLSSALRYSTPAPTAEERREYDEFGLDYDPSAVGESSFSPEDYPAY